MKFILPITFIAILIFSSCEKTSITNGPDIQPPLVALSYDGANNDAPLLPAATYEAATMFPKEDISDLLGGKLIEVYYYIRDVPVSSTIKIYKKSDSDGPLDLIYSEVTTNDLKGRSWNKHILKSPVEITDDDLWISLKFTHTSQTGSIGCDLGPAVDNGDWLLDSADGLWIPLSQRAGININWN
ncbi:MAG: hypothetical protein KDE26_01055, partial [Bacteroidetes bacterium]|nr:hypothetical protein [Bacteroidota bacterium]